jgi:hypothetical protein
MKLRTIFLKMNFFIHKHAAKDALKAVLVPQMVESYGSTLSKIQARSLEQVLIDMYGLGKNGGKLLNKINSIAK